MSENEDRILVDVGCEWLLDETYMSYGKLWPNASRMYARCMKQAEYFQRDGELIKRAICKSHFDGMVYRGDDVSMFEGRGALEHLPAGYEPIGGVATRAVTRTKMSEEKRIYVVLPATVDTIHTRYDWLMGGPTITTKEKRVVVQVPGRQIAQACHVVSKLRLEMAEKEHAFCLSHISNRPITTIILECRNQKELTHVFTALTGADRQPTLFQDENPAVYGDVKPITALAVYAFPYEVEGLLDYLPLWGAQ